jgi:FkbM family methyltransferase
MLDIGAGFGYFSVLAATAANGVRVAAVEPSPKALRLLRFNLWLNGVDARVWPVALTTERSAVPLSASEDNSCHTRAVPILEGEPYSVVVPGVPGDEIIGREQFDIVRVDVQGFELDVLLGMQQFVGRSPGTAFLVEFCPRAIRQRNIDPLGVIDGYARMGLSPTVVGEGTLECLTSEAIVGRCDSAGTGGSLTLLLRTG